MSDDEKPAKDEKPATGGGQARRGPKTAPMTHRETGKTWEAHSRAEVDEMTTHGWGLDDPAQDLSRLPSGARSPGRGTPTGAKPAL